MRFLRTSETGSTPTSDAAVRFLRRPAGSFESLMALGSLGPMEDVTPADGAAPPPGAATSSEIPAWISRLVWKIAGIIVLLWALFHITSALRNFLVLLLISFFLATALEPAVTYLEGRGWRRGIATASVFFWALIIGIITIGMMVPVAVSQARELADNLPRYSSQLADYLQNLNIDVSEESVLDSLGGTDFATSLGGRAFGVGSVVVGTVFQILTIALFTFYMTADAPRLRRLILRLFPQDRQRELLRIQEIAIEKTGGYVYSRLLLAGIATFLTWVALRIIGVPFAEPLALWVGVISQFVPVVGTYLGGILPVLIALLDDPGKAIWVVVWLVIYQQFENYVLSPRITARTMSLHPAVAFGSAFVGATLLGAPGALMALPVAATIQAWVSSYMEVHEVVESKLLRPQTAPPPGTT